MVSISFPGACAAVHPVPVAQQLGFSSPSLPPKQQKLDLPVATPPKLVRDTVMGAAVITLVRVFTSPLAAVLSLV